MSLINIEKILEEANKYIKDPDVIIDVYDMTYVWTSIYHCEVTGYSKAEQTNMRIAVNSQLENGGDTHQMAAETMNPYKPFERKMIITTKTGDTKTAEINGIVIEFDNQPYIIGKMISVSNP
jgi:hypothetical protein